MAEDSSRREENWPKAVLLFHAAISRIFHDVAGSVSFDEFVNNFTILKETPKKAAGLYEHLVDYMYKNMLGSLDEFVDEDRLADKMLRLQTLTEAAGTPKDHVAWRPPGNVEDHLRAMDAQIIAKRSRDLEEYVTTLELENEQLMQRVLKGREEAQLVDQQLDRLLNAEKFIVSNFQKTTENLDGHLSRIKSWNY